MARRQKELGDFGEDRAAQLLSARGFAVEKMPKNFPFFDLMAKQGARRLLVPVKTRSKHTAKGKLKKDPFNLYTKQGHFESAKKIANFFGAELMWVAVTVDISAKTYCAYAGDVFKLPSPKRILHPTRDVPGHERLAIDVHDEVILESWSNVAARE